MAANTAAAATVPAGSTAVPASAPPRPSDAPVRWLETLGAGDVGVAGGKGANLGELTRLGMPVPPGFVVAAGAFRRFLDGAGLRPGIEARVGALAADDTDGLRRASDELRRRVLAAPFPPELRATVTSAYAELGRRVGRADPFVAVRSSATAEDAPGTSFAGMNETFLDVRGEDALAEAVRGCWASLYGARVLFYRRQQGIPESAMAIAVVVQAMADAAVAGVLFTADPATGDPDTLVVEGAFGEGDTVVGGVVSPDHWEVRKDSLEVLRERVALKRVATGRGPDGRRGTRELPPEEGGRPCLSHERVREIAALGVRAEAHYGRPQDMEWAVDADGRVVVLQARPVTALGGQGGGEPGPQQPAPTPAPAPTLTPAAPLARGLGASPGVRVGVARVLGSPAEGARLADGEVLVARRTDPDWTPLMKRAAAVVTDEGGITAHAAIVARELGIPCVVGTGDGTRRIADGAEVTVDARAGLVYAGRTRDGAAPAGDGAAGSSPAGSSPAGPPTGVPGSPVTATRVYVNLAQPERAEEVAELDVDGVGLLRIEFLVTSVTGNTHPRRMVEDGRADEYRDRLAEGLARFARAFAPRPVVARFTDFRTNEYRGMKGGDAFEPEEANPMIGYRGAYRYVREPDLFRLEAGAFAAARGGEGGLTNLIPMVPFVRTLSELSHCVRLMNEAGLPAGTSSCPLWIMAEVPSVLYRLPEYVREGVTGVSIGSNDLTQLMLGVDRDSAPLAPLFDERDPGVLRAIRAIVLACRDLGITCSICGQAPSVYPEYAEQLVAWGIDSVSVNPDAIDRTRRAVARAEHRLLVEHARRAAAAAAARPPGGEQ